MHFFHFLVLELHVAVAYIGHTDLPSVSKNRWCVMYEQAYFPSAVSRIPALPVLLATLGTQDDGPGDPRFTLLGGGSSHLGHLLITFLSVF